MEQTNWYAIYTASRAEKRVKKRLDEAGIVYYIPSRVVEWNSDNQVKRVEVPLFSNCVFVRLTRSEFSKIQDITGIISFLREGETPVVYSEQQITSLRLLNDHAEEIDVVEGDIPVTSSVRVIQGKLLGLEGELLDEPGVCRVLVRLPRVGNVIAAVSQDSVVRL